MKNIKYGKNKHKRTRSSVFIHTKTQSVTIQGNITALRYWNGVIWSFFLLHVRANLGMMLARDYASCHGARRTKTQMACKTSEFKSYWPLVGPTDMQGLCTAPTTKSQGAHACYSSDVCGHSTIVYIYRHILSISTWYLDVDATPGGCTKYWNEIKYNVIWFCSFCFKSVNVNPLI